MFDTKSKYGQRLQGPSNDGATLSHTDSDSLNTPRMKIKKAEYVVMLNKTEGQLSFTVYSKRRDTKVF